MRSVALIAVVIFGSSQIIATQDYNGDGRADIAFYRPDGVWNSIPFLSALGNGGWIASNNSAPGWANASGVIAVSGDYNRDGRSDIAFHRPGSVWASVPVLFSSVNGNWTSSNFAAPGWANQSGVTAIAGDYNGDGRSDIAFHRPSSDWASVPVLFSNGDGSWTSTNFAAPSWANQPGVIAIAGDYNRDGRADIAFHRPDGVWNSVPVLFSNGNGGWIATNFAAPSWANQPGAIAISGDFNGDRRWDVAFHRPDGVWNSVPVIFSNGNGSWASTNFATPGWANQARTIAISGDYNRDGRTDIAFYQPAGIWGSVPLLVSNGNGSWTSFNPATPIWANQLGVVAVSGDYNGDGRADIAFYRPNAGWNSVPVLLSAANQTWTAANFGAPDWANQLGAIAVQSKSRHAIMGNPAATNAGSDANYDRTSAQNEEWRRAFEPWKNFLDLFVRAVLGYEEFLRRNGLNGDYDGVISNGTTSTTAYMRLLHRDNEVHGFVLIRDPTVRLNGGICSDLMVPVSVLPIYATSSDAFHASGSSTRNVGMIGVFSGSVTTSFNLGLESVNYRTLTGTVAIDVPWPCSDQALSFRFVRRPL